MNSSNQETLLALQQPLVEVADVVEDRRQAFFETPEDIETIHRFRTKSRTLRSLLAFIKPWQRHKQNAEAQIIIRDIVRHTSRQRELDVFQKQALADPNSSPEFLELCEREATTERTALLATLSSPQVTQSFERAMALVREVAWKNRYRWDGLYKSDVRARFDAMVQAVSAQVEDLDLQDEERTHDVRKRAKRMRYVAEHYGDILGPDAVGIAKGMMAHQDNLGDICDARANIRLINEFLQQDLSDTLVAELKRMRAQNEDFLMRALEHKES